jgi:hypothetical protein
LVFAQQQRALGSLTDPYGLRRSRLKGYDGARIWTGWAILAYNLDTYGHFA